MDASTRLLPLPSERNALLQVFPPGEEGGNGLADVLTGKVNPSGRLPVSMPRSVGQVPNYVGQRAGGDHPMFFGDYIDSPTSPLFAFGHGLSYTTFAYNDLAVQATSTTEPIEVSIEVRNTGERAGDEVVQLYYRDQVASVARPDRMLLGFTRLSLAAGADAQGHLYRASVPAGLLRPTHAFRHRAGSIHLQHRSLLG